MAIATLPGSDLLSDETHNQPTMMIEVDLSDLDVRSFPNSRRRVDLKEIDKLAKNINKRGLLQSPIVRRKSLDTIALQENGTLPGDPDKAYEVIAGFRRVLACLHLASQSKDVRYRMIVVRLVDVADDEARLINLSENLHRTDLSFVDQTEALSGLEGMGLTGQQIADRLGVKRAWVAQRISFRRHADPALQDVVERRILPFATAYKIFTRLGGVNTDEDNRQAQGQAAAAALQANQTYLDKVQNKLEKSSERKRQTVIGRAAIEVALQHQVRKIHSGGKGRSRSGEILQVGVLDLQSVSGLVERLRSLQGVGGLDAYGRGILDALLAVTGAPGAPNLFEVYLADVLTGIQTPVDDQP